MKKVILCVFLIVFVFCGCTKSSNNSLSSAISSIDTSVTSNTSASSNISQATTTSSIAASENNHIITINKPMQYFFVEHSFVGGYSDQKWVSVIDPKEPNNTNLNNDFLLIDCQVKCNTSVK